MAAESVVIRLNPARDDYARWTAAKRQETAPARQAHGCEGGLGEHLLGARGETAFGVWAYGNDHPFILTISTYRTAPDFPPDIEIRARSRPGYELMIRRDDRNNRRYVLVLPHGTDAWLLAGWLWGHQARNPDWLKAHGGREPAWFVPHAALHPMSALTVAPGRLGA